MGTAENTPHVKRGAPLPRETAVFGGRVGREMFIRVRICFGFFAICNRGFGFRYEVVAGIYFGGGMLRGARDRDETAASYGVFGGRGGEG